MNGDMTVTVVPLTAEIFKKHLSKEGSIQNHFAENAGVLIKQMQNVCSPSENGARTYGFVIPHLTSEESQRVRALLSSTKSRAEINFFGKVPADNNTVARYVHITLHTIRQKRSD